MDRNANIGRARDRTTPWDMVVIGGGATGVGCALDAATRGLDVLLVEQGDFGCGTSSRSTKLVHGGVRYLRQGNISLVTEALKERSLMLTNAPHVAHVQDFIVPCYGICQKLFYGAGLKLYDRLAGKHSIGGSRILSREEAIERLPTVRRDGLTGGVLYLDGQFDDMRMLMDMAVTADANGACLINYVRVTGFDINNGRIDGVKLFDMITAEGYQVSARSVINATGAYCDPVRQMSDAAARAVVTLARGSHIVLDRKFLPTDAGVMIPKTPDGRVLFCIPWLGHVLVGTTDVACETTELGQVASQQEIDFLLKTAGAYLTTQPTPGDILSKWAGVRPLVSRSNTSRTASLSRGHQLFVDDVGLVTITGGKWTTYRRMAEDAVDKAVLVAGLNAGTCITGHLPIRKPVVSTTDQVQLHSDLPYTRNDLVRAVHDEMAQTIEDVLARRTRALFLNARAARELAPLVSDLITVELGRNDSQTREEMIRFEIASRQYMSTEN